MIHNDFYFKNVNQNFAVDSLGIRCSSGLSRTKWEALGGVGGLAASENLRVNFTQLPYTNRFTEKTTS